MNPFKKKSLDSTPATTTAAPWALESIPEIAALRTKHATLMRSLASAQAKIEAATERHTTAQTEINTHEAAYREAISSANVEAAREARNAATEAQISLDIATSELRAANALHDEITGDATVLLTQIQACERDARTARQTAIDEELRHEVAGMLIERQRQYDEAGLELKWSEVFGRIDHSAELRASHASPFGDFVATVNGGELDPIYVRQHERQSSMSTLYRPQVTQSAGSAR